MQIREYLIGVTAVALACGIVKVLLPEKDAVGTVVKLFLGALMLLVTLRPLSGGFNDVILDWTGGFNEDAKSIVQDAQTQSQEAIRARIKEQAESYILAKAETLGAEIEASVILSEESVAVPVGVRIEGAVSPYAKQVMMQAITNDLGINREAQQWIG